MSEILNYFSLGIRKIEETENDYEMITSLNPCFTVLPPEKLKQVEEISLRAIGEIQEVLKSDTGRVVKPI